MVNTNSYHINKIFWTGTLKNNLLKSPLLLHYHCRKKIPHHPRNTKNNKRNMITKCR